MAIRYLKRGKDAAAVSEADAKVQRPVEELLADDIAALETCIQTSGACGLEVSQVSVTVSILPYGSYSDLESATLAYVNAGCIMGDEVPECGSLAADVLAESKLVLAEIE